MKAHLIAAEVARALGLQPLTTGYLPSEHSMLENVIRDMSRSGRKWALVLDHNGLVEVWVRSLGPQPLEASYV